MIFAIVHKEDLAPEMEFKKLIPEQYVLVASNKWKTRKLTDIIKNERIIDFDRSDKITLSYLKYYSLFDMAKQGRYFVNRTENLALLVSEGVGYTVLAKEFAQSYVDNDQLIILNSNKVHEIIPFLAWYSRHEPPYYFSAIMNAIQ